jgi:hypothetical protein
MSRFIKTFQLLFRNCPNPHFLFHNCKNTYNRAVFQQTLFNESAGKGGICVNYTKFQIEFGIAAVESLGE